MRRQCHQLKVSYQLTASTCVVVFEKRSKNRFEKRYLKDKRYLKAAWLIVLLEFFIAGNAIADRTDLPIEKAVSVVESLHNALLAVAAESDLTFQQRADKLTLPVRNAFDFPYISRFLLRRSWADLDPAQQERFNEAFERLSIANYASRFAKVSADSLVIGESSAKGAKRAQVMASVSIDNRDVPLSYLLQPASDQRSDGWAIVNVIADGVSDLALRRAEFRRVVSDKGFDGLLDHIELQIEDLQ